MNKVRERNDSAWLLPAGPGSNHRLRAEMDRVERERNC